MEEIIPLFAPFAHCISKAQLRHLSCVLTALLALTGRVTMRGLSRWGGEGTSYRTIQRFFEASWPWAQLFWLFFRHHLFRPDEVYLLAGDETVITKAGHKTWGLDRFFSSIYNRPVPGLSFFVFSLVAVGQGVSHPLRLEQIVKTEAEKNAAKAAKTAKTAKAAKTAKTAKAAPASRGAGRRAGVPNKDKRQITWTPELKRIERLGQQVLQQIAGLFPLTYVVLDGHFGNNGVCQVVCQVVRQKLKLHLICKLRHDSVLYFLPPSSSDPVAAPRRGRPPLYGERVRLAATGEALPAHLCIHDTLDVSAGVQTQMYQALVRSPHFSDGLNVVFIVKTNLRDGRRCHVVLFSSDLTLAGEKLVQYYRLRFQIEFNFRDAKSHFGLEDWMNIGQTQVTNATHLSFFAVGVSQCLLGRLRERVPAAGVLDLKARFRGRFYASATLKLLPLSLEPIVKEAILNRIAEHGTIHAQTHTLNGC